MSATANRNCQIMVSTKVDSMDHIRCMLTTRNQCRSFIDHAVVNPARFVVPGVARLDQFPVELRRKRPDSLLGKFVIGFGG